MTQHILRVAFSFLLELCKFEEEKLVSLRDLSKNRTEVFAGLWGTAVTIDLKLKKAIIFVAVMDIFLLNPRSIIPVNNRLIW